MSPLRPRYSKIRKEVEDLLTKGKIRRPPVPVDLLAELLDAQVIYSEFENDVSGLLVRRGESTVIGVNSQHSKVRQRFTIAHEIGHLLMHGHDAEEVHVDTNFRVHLRSPVSSTAEDVAEIEANAFAAELLMPRDWLIEHAAKLTLDLESSDAGTKELADMFSVSVQAMTFRLTNVLHLRYAEPG